MSAFELRPLARMGENAWKLIVYGLIINFNAIGPSIEVPDIIPMTLNLFCVFILNLFFNI